MHKQRAGATLVPSHSFTELMKVATIGWRTASAAALRAGAEATS